MIKIVKHGKFAKKFFTGCKKCGCEFIFTTGDYIGRNGKSVSIQCPECKHRWYGKYMGDIAWCGLELDFEIKK